MEICSNLVATGYLAHRLNQYVGPGTIRLSVFGQCGLNWDDMVMAGTI